MAPAQGGAHLKQCDLLKLSRRQKQLCRREPGLAETLQDAAHLSLLECQFQLRQERWNCSLEGRTGLLKRGREEGRVEEEGRGQEEGRGEVGRGGAGRGGGQGEDRRYETQGESRPFSSPGLCAGHTALANPAQS